MKKKIFFCLVSLLISSVASNEYLAEAQQRNSKKKNMVPPDPGMRKGRLSNGFTYYIKDTENLSDLIQIKFVVKVGARTDFSELAHLVEHLAYEGSLQFPKDSAVRHMALRGMKFAYNYNAHTGNFQTIYSFDIPLKQLDVINDVFNIIFGFAGHLSFDEDRVSAQKGSVIEEIRVKLESVSARELAKKNAKVFDVIDYGSEYLSAGEANMLNLTRDSIVSFYRKWYRPDLEAIVVVGDIDADVVEELTRDTFGKLKMRTDEVPDPVTRRDDQYINRKRRLIFTDNTLGDFSDIEIYCKRPARVNMLNRVSDYREFVEDELLIRLLTYRFGRVPRKYEVAPIEGWVTFDYLEAGRDALVFRARSIRHDSLKHTLGRMVKELRRLKQFGFSKEEFRKIKEEYRENVDKVGDRYNVGWRCVENFIFGKSIPSSDYEHYMVLKYIDDVRLNDVNRELGKWIDIQNNIDFVFSGASSDFNENDFNSYVESVFDRSPVRSIETEHISQMPAIDGLDMSDSLGSIAGVSTCAGDSTIKIIHLCNGATIVLARNHSEGERVSGRVGILGRSPGGASMYTGRNRIVAENVAYAVAHSGAGGLNKFQIEDLRLSKGVSVSPFVSSDFDQIAASGRSSDIELLFQLIYSYFVNPRKDVLAFNDWKRMKMLGLQVVSEDPTSYFRDLVSHFVSGAGMQKQEDIDSMTLDDVLNIYSERFSGVCDFTFVISGDFEYDESLMALIRRYLGNIRSGTRDSLLRYEDDFMSRQIDTVLYRGNFDMADVQLFLLSDARIADSREHILLMKVLSRILSQKVWDRLRSDEGGVYSSAASLEPLKLPTDSIVGRVAVQFSCKKGQEDYLLSCVTDEISILQNEIVSEDRLAVAIDDVSKSLLMELGGDGYNSILRVCFPDSVNNSSLVTDLLILSRFTTSDIKDFSKKNLHRLKTQKFILLPEDF